MNINYNQKTYCFNINWEDLCPNQFNFFLVEWRFATLRASGGRYTLFRGSNQPLTSQINKYIYIYIYIVGNNAQSNKEWTRIKCFIKLFTRIETSSNFQNSHQKILQKIQFYEFRSVKSSSQLIECSFQSIK